MDASETTREPEASIDAENTRKADHIRLALDARMQLGVSAFDGWRLEHKALPEIALDDVDPTTTFLGRELALPLLISSMTGGTEEAARINRNLAQAAQHVGVAMAVGSQRRGIEHPEDQASYQVRQFAPSVPILANLGAVQLNYGFGPDECRRAVDMVEADALILHLNPLQEAIQPEGQTDFSGLLDRIGEVVTALDVPVIVKEIGSGISADVGRALAARGVQYIDCAGMGGTSWARIEGRRAADRTLGEAFADWGIPTPEALVGLRELTDVSLIASGGIRTGIEVAKAIALGADLAGVAQPFLVAADQSRQAVEDVARWIGDELRIAMFCTGAATLSALKKVPIHREPGASA